MKLVEPGEGRSDRFRNIVESERFKTNAEKHQLQQILLLDHAISQLLLSDRYLAGNIVGIPLSAGINRELVRLSEKLLARIQNIDEVMVSTTSESTEAVDTVTKSYTTALDALEVFMIHAGIPQASAHGMNDLEIQQSVISLKQTREEMKRVSTGASDLFVRLRDSANSKHFSDVVSEYKSERRLWLLTIVLIAASAVAFWFTGDPPDINESWASWLVTHIPFILIGSVLEWLSITQFSQTTRQLREYRYRQAVADEINSLSILESIAKDDPRIDLRREAARTMFSLPAPDSSDAPIEEAAAKVGSVISSLKG